MFEASASGPTIPYAGDCGMCDLDTGNDIDQSDFGVFQCCYSGQNNLGDPHCAD